MVIYIIISSLFAGAIPLTDSLFAEESRPVLITSLSCTGDEQSIYNCSINTGAPQGCGRFEDAGVICQRSNTTRDNCSTGSVRLANKRVMNDTAEGIVEVCINQAWGTVCNRRFDNVDAGTVCIIAGGFRRSGMLINRNMILIK